MAKQKEYLIKYQSTAHTFPLLKIIEGTSATIAFKSLKLKYSKEKIILLNIRRL